MKKALTIVTIIAFTVLLAASANAQSLLSPTELFSVHQLKDSVAITALVKEKGYKPAYGWGNSDDKVSNWIFQTRLGENVDFHIRKRITQKNTSTYYWITNDFYYHQFMAAALKENYKFTEVRLMDKQLYFVFKNGDKVFYTNQEHNTASTIYTVLIQ